MIMSELGIIMHAKPNAKPDVQHQTNLEIQCPFSEEHHLFCL